MGDLAIEWWKKYIDADFLKRQELISSLPLVKELANNGFPNLSKSKSKIDSLKNLSKEQLLEEQKKLNNHMLVTMISSYVEDLINAVNDDKKVAKKIKVQPKKTLPIKVQPKKIEVKKVQPIFKLKNHLGLKNCKVCGKEIIHARRGMCLNCYRRITGLSKPKKS